MRKELLQRLRAKIDVLPSCIDYADLLDYSHIKTGINYEGLRKAMGLATYKQWAKFLNVS